MATLMKRASTLEKAMSYQEAVSLKEEFNWRKLGEISVRDAVEIWLGTLQSTHTRDNYLSAFNQIIQLKLFTTETSLQQLAMINADALIDQIKQVDGWSEATKQARAAAFLSFFRFLSRRTGGLIQRAMPSREGTSKTFFKIREKVTTPAMTQAQWTKWIEHLSQINKRDCLIAKITLQGGRRIGEVLSLTTDKIDFLKGEITFRQSKTKGLLKEQIITYPESVMKELKNYIRKRSGTVFITSSGREVLRRQVAITFKKAGECAKIPFLVTPHVLRASTITYLKSQGFNDSEIRKITGHASGEMIAAYDKRSGADNLSKKVNLVN